MVVEFKTIEEDGIVYVVYNRDDDKGNMIQVAKMNCPKNEDGQPDPISGIIRLLQRVQAEPHMIFEVYVRVTGTDMKFSVN